MRVLTPTLEAVEDAILAALRGDAILATRMRNVELDIQSFRGESDDAIATVVQRQPAILVLYGGTQFEPMGMHQFRGTDAWFLLVFASNLRAEAARRRPAPAGEVGAYELCEHALRILSGVDLALTGLGTLEPGATELVETSTKAGKSLTAYQITFACSHALRDVTPEQALTELRSRLEVAGADDDGETTWTEIVIDIITPSEES